MGARSMEILQVTRNKGRGSGYSVKEGEEEIATIRHRHGRSPANLTIEGKAYSVDRESGWRSFALTGENGVLARAVRANAFESVFDIQFNGRELALKRTHEAGFLKWSTTYDLYEDARRVGSVGPVTRGGCIAKLPSGLPVPVKVFVLWLALRWPQTSGGASGPGA
jgi:hypothetical protein